MKRRMKWVLLFTAVASLPATATANDIVYDGTVKATQTMLTGGDVFVDATVAYQADSTKFACTNGILSGNSSGSSWGANDTSFSTYIGANNTLWEYQGTQTADSEVAWTLTGLSANTTYTVFGVGGVRSGYDYGYTISTVSGSGTDAARSDACTASQGNACYYAANNLQSWVTRASQQATSDAAGNMTVYFNGPSAGTRGVFDGVILREASTAATVGVQLCRSSQVSALSSGTGQLGYYSFDPQEGGSNPISGDTVLFSATNTYTDPDLGSFTVAVNNADMQRIRTENWLSGGDETNNQAVGMENLAKTEYLIRNTNADFSVDVTLEAGTYEVTLYFHDMTASYDTPPSRDLIVTDFDGVRAAVEVTATGSEDSGGSFIDDPRPDGDRALYDHRRLRRIGDLVRLRHGRRRDAHQRPEDHRGRPRTGVAAPAGRRCGGPAETPTLGDSRRVMSLSSVSRRAACMPPGRGAGPGSSPRAPTTTRPFAAASRSLSCWSSSRSSPCSSRSSCPA